MFDDGAWLGWAFIIAVLAVVALAPRSDASISRSVDRLAAKVGLAPVPELMTTLERRVQLQRRAIGIGGALGASLVLIGLRFAIGDRWSLQANWLTVGAVYGSGALGNAIAALLQPRWWRGGARLARGVDVTLDDYVPPIERVAARGAAVAGLGATAVAAVFRRIDGVDLAAGAVVVLSLALFELGARRVVRKPQPVGSTNELAWDDAFRAVNLRALASAPEITGLYAVLAAAAQFDERAEWTTIGIVVTTVVVVLIVAIASPSPARHYLRRLWPDTAAAAEAAERAVRLP